MTNLYFESFNRTCSGKVITHFGDVVIVQSRNPYGTHNLVAVQECDGDYVAFRHGNLVVFDWCNMWAPLKKLRKLFTYMVKKGILNQQAEVVGEFRMMQRHRSKYKENVND